MSAGVDLFHRLYLLTSENRSVLESCGEELLQHCRSSDDLTMHRPIETEMKDSALANTPTRQCQNSSC